MEMRPFEGILGNSSALRILEFLLPREDLEFNIQELADKVGVSWPTAHKVIEKYVEWNILKGVQEHGNAMYYELNKDSSLVALFEDFNNLVIEGILTEDELYQIDEYWRLHAPQGEKLAREDEPLRSSDLVYENRTWGQFDTQKTLRENLRRTEEWAPLVARSIDTNNFVVSYGLGNDHAA
jgi:hypothetical protein